LDHGVTTIGSATLQSDSSILDTPGNIDVAENAGLYAAAYTVGNEIVISFRGTDGGFGGYWSDFALSVGSNIPPQALLAVQFYDVVKANNPTADIVLTGHSLGGALAGIVGMVRGEDAVLFDNVSYVSCANEIFNQATELQGTVRDDFYGGAAPTPFVGHYS
jgi:hypothetical protein